MPWYIYLAVRQLLPSGSRFPSIFFLMSVLGVTLGVALLIGVQSVMGGFGYILRSKIVATEGHVTVSSGGIMYDYAGILSDLEGDVSVAAVNPSAQGVVMLQFRGRPAFPFIRGIDASADRSVIDFDRFLQSGKLLDLDDESIFLSSSLARQLGVLVGDYVEIYSPLMLEKAKDEELLLPRELEVVGVYETGWNTFDSSTMVCSLNTMRDLYGMRDSIHNISIRLHEGVDERIFAQELNDRLDFPNRAVTWEEMNKDFLWVLALEKNLMLILMLFVVLVAAFAIAIAQLMTVMRKTREIGILCAIGSSQRSLATCYCIQGLFIGIIGVASGMSLAVGILHYRDAIVGTLAELTGTRDTLVQFYQFYHLPVHYSLDDFIIVGLSTLVLTTLAGFLPAMRAARMKPADALRSE